MAKTNGINSQGILYAVKVGGTGPDARTTLATAIREWGLDHEEANDLALYLIDELQVGASAQSRKTLYNSIIRAGNAIGIPMLLELRKMFNSAKKKANETGDRAARGRMRGLAQAIVFVESPYTYLDATPGERAQMIQAQERK